MKNRVAWRAAVLGVTKSRARLSNPDFPGGPVVKNPPCNVGDMGSIRGLGTKIPHAMEQISPTTTEPML